VNTEELTNKLKEYDDIGAFIQENENAFDDNAFKNYLEELLRRNDTYIATLAKDSGVSIPYTHNLFSGRRNAPRKDILLRLAFGLKLNLDETNRLLTLGGTAPLRSKVRRESIVIFCINKGYTLEQADELMHHYSLPTFQSV
jgi:transcriptional regulator with XRE-family HTH domain